MKAAKKKKDKDVKKFEGQDIYSFSNAIFSSVAKKLPIYDNFDKKLRIARISTTGIKYGSFIIFSSFLTLFVTFVFLLAFGSAIYGIKAHLIFVYLMIAILVSILVGVIIYLYPNFMISDRRAKLDNSLAFATLYLSTIIRSGLPPQTMFKMLSRFKHYNVVSEEADKISSDIHVLGLDLPSALERAMKRSPSLNWTELLAGLKNSITAGGDIGKYLEEKSKGFIADYKRKLSDFSNILSLFMNMYITLVIVGIVFFIIISSLMVTVGGMSVAMVKFIQYLVIFAGLPGLTALFIILIKSLSPWSE